MFYKILILLFLLLPLSIQASVFEKYSFFNIERNNAESEYRGFISQQPVLQLERENPELYWNWNFITYSYEGMELNNYNIYFINEFLGQEAQNLDNLSLLTNTTSLISGLIYNIQNERNPIRKNILIENFYQRIQEEYNNIDYESFYQNKIFYNPINVRGVSDYIYHEKLINIEFSSSYRNNTNISLYCTEDLKFGYIRGNQNNLNFTEGVNQNTFIYISLPNDLKEQLIPTRNNNCILQKRFETHEEAIQFTDVLQKSSSRFIMQFTFNEEQSSNSFYREATSTQFGLYRSFNNYLNLFEDFNLSQNEEDIYFIQEIFKNNQENNFFYHQNNFNIQEDFNTELFYNTPIGYIRLDIQNSTAFLFKENEYKTQYFIEKEDNYYILKLKQVDFFTSPNIPREIYLRKLNNNYDLFVNYTFLFNTHTVRIDTSETRNINY